MFRHCQSLRALHTKHQTHQPFFLTTTEFDNKLVQVAYNEDSDVIVTIPATTLKIEVCSSLTSVELFPGFRSPGLNKIQDAMVDAKKCNNDDKQQCCT